MPNVGHRGVGVCQFVIFFFLMIRPPPRSTPFPYTTLFRSFDGTTAKFTTRVNQFVAPNDLSPNGTLWKLLGVVTISSGKLAEKLTNAANNQVVADAGSEENTPELQSPCNLECRLLLEKKKNTTGISSRPSWYVNDLLNTLMK